MKVLRHAVETELGELVGLAWRWRVWLLLFAIGGALAGLLIAVLATPRYHAYVSILPRQGFLEEQQIVLGHAELANSVKLRPLTASNSQNLVVAASALVRESMVDSLGLISFFDLDDAAVSNPSLAKYRAVEALRMATHFELSLYRDVLFIHVTTRDPRMSADIANLYVHAIERENLKRYKRQSELMIDYLEVQLDTVRDRIFALSDSVAHYYREEGLVQITGEQELLYSLLEELELQSLALNLALNRERQDRSEDDPRVRRLAEQTEIYREMLASLKPEFGDAGPTRGPGIDAGTILEARRFNRTLRNLERLEASVGTEFAAVVMESQRDEGHLPLMDRAVPPVEPVWPNPSLLILGLGLLSPILFYLAVLLVAAHRAGGPSPVEA